MEKVDKFIEFLIDNRSDSRIKISKKIKYGFRCYFLVFEIDPAPDKNTPYPYRERMEIIFDGRNRCIEVYREDEENPIVIENDTLLDKWSNKIEEILSENIEDKVLEVFNNSLNKCFNKNLYRDLQILKLFKQDDTL